jgi:hypothetical protein
LLKDALSSVTQLFKDKWFTSLRTLQEAFLSQRAYLIWKEAAYVNSVRKLTADKALPLISMAMLRPLASFVKIWWRSAIAVIKNILNHRHAGD